MLDGKKRGWRCFSRVALLVSLLALIALAGDPLRQAIRRALATGWLVAPALPLFLLWTLAAARGWQVLFGPSGTASEIPRLWRLAQIRIEAQALNLALPLSGIAGEVLRASTTASSRRELWLSSKTVVLDSLASTAAGVVFSICGIGLYRAGPHWPDTRVLGGALGALAALCLLALVVVPRVATWLAARARPSLGTVAEALARGGAPLRGALGRSGCWHLVERALPSLEVLLFARGLGYGLSAWSATYACALMTGATLCFFFIPAQLGAAEGALALAFATLGQSERAGLEVALLRRLRQVVVAVAGLTLLALVERRAIPKAADPIEGGLAENAVAAPSFGGPGKDDAESGAGCEADAEVESR